MTSFETKHEKDILGRLEGFDRIIYRAIASFLPPMDLDIFSKNVL